MSTFILSQPTAWSNTAKYQPTANGITVVIPTVLYNSKVYYLNGSANAIVGTAPSSDSAWTAFDGASSSLTLASGNVFIGNSSNVATETPFSKISNVAASAPTTSNDNTQGYMIGSLWTDTSTGYTYTCTNTSTGAAVWLQHSVAP